MFLKLLEKNIRYGQLELQLYNGKSYRFGNHGPYARWQIHNPATMWRIVHNWEFELGETYINGGWDYAGCELRDLLSILRYNFQEVIPQGMTRAAMLMLRIPQQLNRLRQSQRNVSHHYDLDANLFRSFLDQDMHYSCAYYEQDSLSLDAAQQAKCQHIAQKLLISPGQHILDIGSGWGSMALYLARHYDVQVTGLTLSEEQLKIARQRAKDAGLENRVNFLLQDYRNHQGQYDRIVSIGMFEHVGRPNFNRYFHQLKNLLNNTGHALIHSIGRSGPPDNTNPWIRKHIFPGGYIPALSEMTASIEKSLLVITDVEVLREHYALTLAAWYQRFSNARDEILERHGERFYRLWEFYLNSCEIAFRHSDLLVFQVQIAKSRNTLPITRDYMQHPSRMAVATPEENNN